VLPPEGAGVSRARYLNYMQYEVTTVGAIALVPDGVGLAPSGVELELTRFGGLP
jgi:hypothetical protein